MPHFDKKVIRRSQNNNIQVNLYVFVLAIVIIRFVPVCTVYKMNKSAGVYIINMQQAVNINACLHKLRFKTAIKL